MTLLGRDVLRYHSDSLQQGVGGAGEDHEDEDPQDEPGPPGHHPVCLGVEDDHLVALGIFVPEI